MRVLFLIVICTIAASGVVGQTAWTQPEGRAYLKLSQDIIRAGKFYNPDGDVIDITTTSVYTTGLYGELGISNRLTAIVTYPIVVRSTINNKESTADGYVIPGDEFGAIGDVRFGLKFGIIQDKAIILAVSGEVKTPTGKNTGGESELLQSGDGAWGATGLAHISHSFYPTPIYISGYAGYQWRGKADLDYSTGTESVDYDDAIRWGAEVGWTPDEQWFAAVKLNQVIALEDGSGGGITGSSSIFGNRISYLVVGPEAAYSLKNGLGFSLSAVFALTGKNILAAPNINVGVVYLLD